MPTIGSPYYDYTITFMLRTVHIILYKSGETTLISSMDLSPFSTIHASLVVGVVHFIYHYAYH